ncbi:MAG TPA: DUF2335 domain-containing protein, partial [Solirubrobacteraceae bacterium]|nr:DUF2335 domain-containing protein [Solirubrobacteraceae bacterium]
VAMSDPKPPADRQGVEPEVLERAAERGAERAVAEFRSVSIERQGMLPDPEELARYQTHFPGLGERIVSWTEDELDHRRAIDRRAVEASLHLAARGQRFAFIWAVLALAAAVVLALDGKNAGAISALAAAVVPVLIAFAGGALRSRASDQDRS